eukprot:4045139-Pyramimonas_sp.AAC.1
MSEPRCVSWHPVRGTLATSTGEPWRPVWGTLAPSTGAPLVFDSSSWWRAPTGGQSQVLRGIAESKKCPGRNFPTSRLPCTLGVKYILESRE